MASDKVMTAIGLMAGPRLDGITAAIIRTDGMGTVEPVTAVALPYDRQTKIEIARAAKAAMEGREGAEDIARAADEVTTAHIGAVRKVMEKARLLRQEIDVIGFHGQTILHRAPIDSSAPGRSWQIGAGRTLSDETRIDVVDQFRQADIAAGGYGAPLTPIYHAALVRNLARHHAVAVLTVGDLASVSFVPASGDMANLLAFDCGPGRGVVDEWVDRQGGRPIGGDESPAQGRVDEQAVRMMALNPYLRRPGPKFLKRRDVKTNAVEGLGVADGAATLTAFVAACVAKSESLLPAVPGEWIVCGGQQDAFLMAQLSERLSSPVHAAEDVGWSDGHIEAECCAYLAVRSLKQLPLSFPKTTSVPYPMNGGVYHRAPV